MSQINFDRIGRISNCSVSSDAIRTPSMLEFFEGTKIATHFDAVKEFLISYTYTYWLAFRSFFAWMLALEEKISIIICKILLLSLVPCNTGLGE